MKLEFEYGQGLMSAELPDSTDVFIPGQTVADPSCIEQTWETLYATTLDSIRNPIGMPTLTQLAHKGSKVAFVIPDIVKGGNQPTSHRKVAIPAWMSCTAWAWRKRTCCCCSPMACIPAPRCRR